MRALLKVALLSAAVALVVFVGRNVSYEPQVAAKAGSDKLVLPPEKALEQGLKLEAAWKRSQTPGGPYPPDPAYVDEADRMLTEIPLDWPKAEEATALVLRLRAARPEIVKAYATAEKALAAKIAAEREARLLELRRNAAKTMETTFLDGGKDVYVTAEGKEFRTLRIRYVLMGRPTVHQISKNADLLGKWSEFGFRDVILTDGYRETWNVKLNWR